MAKRELVSIIVPIYNAQDTIRRCLDSICAQTYKEIEILAIDDGSTDDSRKILEEYEKKLGFYRQFEQQSQKTDEVLDYVKNKYPDDRKLIELVENLEKMEE